MTEASDIPRHWRLGKLARIETAMRRVTAALAELETLRSELAADDLDCSPPPREKAGPLEVVTVVAGMLGATVANAIGGRKYKGAIRARHASALALRRLGLSYPHIAVVLGLGDHGSAMYACERATVREQDEPAFAQAVTAGVLAGRGQAVMQ